MTDARKRSGARVLWAAGLFLLFFCLYEQNAILKGARRGIGLCFENVVPSLFPFMILSDLLASLASESNGLYSFTFCRVFRTQPKGAHAFLMGALGGFPLGAKTVCLAYEKGELTQKEAEHLLGFVNVTGPAFLVAGVGAALRGSAAQGFVFYGIQILSALLVGRITAPKERRNAAPFLLEAEPFSLAHSLAKNTKGMLSICGTIVFFSAVASLFCVILPENISVFLLSFLEITTGIDAIADVFGTVGLLSFSLTSAAVCFGGICVGTQSAVFAKKAGLSMKSYFKGKLLCAVFGFLFGALWCALA